MSLRPFAALTVLALGALAGVSHAATITDTLTVSAPGSAGQTVTLSYALTWDPTQNYVTPSTAGITLLSATNVDPAFAASFAVPPAWDYFFVPNGSLNIGGIGLSGDLGAVPGENNYVIDIALNGGVPTLQSFVESNLTSVVTLGQGSAVLTPPLATTATTPEPASFALLGTGLLGIAGVVRRRSA